MEEENKNLELEPSENDEVEVDVIEADLDDDAINELIAKLVTLKQTKQPVSFELAEDVELQLTYTESEDETE